MRLKLLYHQSTLKGKAKPWSARATGLAKYEVERLKAGFKGYANYGGIMPTFSEGIQFLQVTDSVFGIGISIGPLFGMAYDLISGGVRWVSGQKVVFKNAPSDIEVYTKATDKMHTYARWRRPAGKMSRSEFISWRQKKIASGTWGVRNRQDWWIQRAIRMHNHGYGFPHYTDYMWETAMYYSAHIAAQGMRNVLNHWDPIIQIEGLEHIEIEAYNEPSPLVEEMLTEEGMDPEAGIGWPSTGKRWGTYEELQTSVAPVAAATLRSFSANCPSFNMRSIGERCAVHCGLQMLEMTLGE